MDIRFVLPPEAEQLARNVMISFPSKMPAALLQNTEDELHRPDGDRYLGCFNDDGILLGSILIMDFALNVRGAMMPMETAAYVSTNFLHKKERVACTLLKVLMRYYTKQGTPIDCLRPFNPAFYANVGYDYYNENYLCQPKPPAICSCGDKSGPFYARLEDRQEILNFYHAYAARTHGATVYHYVDPHRIFDMPYVVVYRRNGRLTGYFTFDFVAVDHYADMYHDLLVPGMIYEGLDTLRQFMTFFTFQIDQIEQVRIFSPDLSLTMLSRNPNTGENRTHDGCIHEVARRTMGHMARIFGVPAYFRMQNRCESPVSRSFVLVLQVDDNFIEGSNGTFLLNVSGSTVEVVEHAQPDVTLSAGTSALSFLMMGAFSLDEALRLGHLTLSDHGCVVDVQRAISWSRRPVNFTYF